VQQVYLWYTVVFQIDSILQRIVTNKRSMLLILNNYVSRNLEVGLGKRYWLLLVADCLGRSPRIQPIANPSAMFTSHELKLEPTQYRVSLALLQGRASASSSRE